MWRYRRIAMLALCAAWAGGASGAQAACTITGVQSMSGAVANLGRYSGASAPVAQTMTVNIVLTIASTGGNCSGVAALLSPAVPAEMSGAGADKLRYDVQTLAGSSLLNTTLPTRTITISAASSSGQTTAAVMLQMQAIAAASQTVASGGYSDAAVRVSVYDQSNTATAVPGISTWFVNAAVNPSCMIDGRAMANDAAGVRVPVSSSGVVTTAPIVRTYANVLCNAPSDISMSSQNGGITNTASAPGGFTNVIHYVAQASFGSGTATLNTATSAMTTGSIDATIGATGTMSVTVTPQQPIGATLINGRYQDILSVTLTPR